MRYDSDTCSVECDAYELCALTQRADDLDAPFTLPAPPLNADGEMYFRIQSEAGAYYEPSVELCATKEISGVYFTLTSVADGIIRHGGYSVVDKIKIFKGKITPRPDKVTLALLKISCYLFSLRESLDTVFARVTCYSLDTKRLRYYSYKYSKEELAEFYFSLLEKVKYRVMITAKRAFERLAARDARFPYGELREGQEIMIREGYSAIKHSKRIFIEAPTGTGKTVSSLFGAIRALGEGYIDKIFYLTPKTATRREAFSAMAKLCEGGARLRTVIITAKEQICPYGLRDGDRRRRCSACCCDRASGYYSRVDAALCEMLENYTGYSRTLIEQTAKKYCVCPYELSLDLSELCEVVICDYNYAFDPSVYFRRYFGSDAERGKYAFLIDEAHNLPDRVREMYSAELSLSSFKTLLECEDDECKALFADAVTAFARIERLCKDTLQADSEGVKHGFYVGSEPYAPITRALSQLLIKANELLKKKGDLPYADAIYDAISGVKKYLKACELFDSSFRFYARSDGEEKTVKCYCLDPAEVLSSLLLRADSVLFFSATLAPFEYFCNVLGASGSAKSVSLPSPFDSSRLCVAVADFVNTRFEGREDNAKRFATVIAASVKARAGNYIAYFPSYKCLEDTYRAFIKKYPKVETVVQRKNMTVSQRESFLSAFREDTGRLRVGFCVLGGVFSEGVDLPGSRLIGSIIFGVGLPALSSEKNMISEYYNASDGDEGERGYDYAYTYPGMNNVLQAAGRVIRSEDDLGIVVLADDRYSLPKYRVLFPEHWKNIQYAGNASSLAEIMRRFWENYP